ncbi:MAG: hypothetical protein ACK5TQ_09115 [Acetobacteraceae bacterium]
MIGQIDWPDAQKLVRENIVSEYSLLLDGHDLQFQAMRPSVPGISSPPITSPSVPLWAHPLME